VIGREQIGFCAVRKLVKSLPVLNSASGARDFRPFRQTFTKQASGLQPGIGYPWNYCGKPTAAAGGARGSNGSWALQRPLWRWRRMRSTVRGSVIKETMRMRAPQVQRRGSVSKIFLIRRAQVLRSSLEESELSCRPLDLEVECPLFWPTEWDNQCSWRMGRISHLMSFSRCAPRLRPPAHRLVYYRSPPCRPHPATSGKQALASLGPFRTRGSALNSNSHVHFHLGFITNTRRRSILQGVR
jgi:hypothetical protein